MTDRQKVDRNKRDRHTDTNTNEQGKNSKDLIKN